MSFNELPKLAIFEILNNLDDLSKLRAMKVFKRWANIFTSSSQMTDFELKIKGNFLKNFEIDDLPEIPIQKVAIKVKARMKVHDAKRLIQVLQNYDESIKSIAIRGNRYKKPIFKQITRLTNLEHLSLRDVEVEDGFYYSDKMTPIKSLHITACHTKVYDTLLLFQGCDSIEKFFLRYYPDDKDPMGKRGSAVGDRVVNGFVKKLPKLKHFNIRNDEFRYYDDIGILTRDFPVKLEKLEVSMLSYEDDGHNDLLFYRTQKDSLKELIVHDTCDPSAFTSMINNKLFTFIFTEMNLKYFRYGKTNLIVNYKRQPASLPEKPSTKKKAGKKRNL